LLTPFRRRGVDTESDHRGEWPRQNEVVMTMIRRHIRSIVAAGTLAAAIAVAVVGTTDPGTQNPGGTNWGRAATHTVVAPR
jgi:hypothetical protein